MNLSVGNALASRAVIKAHGPGSGTTLTSAFEHSVTTL